MFLIVMGVTGCGKTTVGQLLAERLGLPFHDADAYHPPENRAKMSSNIPLGDADRWPWLELLAKHALEWEAEGGAVLACSALKQSYRDVLLKQVTSRRVVYLELPREAVARRLDARRGTHEIVRDYDKILDGQYRDLEPPKDAITISAELSPREIVERAARLLGREGYDGKTALRLNLGSKTARITDDESETRVAELLDQLGPLKRVLLLPPDYTRYHSGAGILTAQLYQRLVARGVEVAVLPATGTHVAMSAEEIAHMFPGVPPSVFRVHDFQRDLVKLGEVPASFVREVSGGLVDYPIECEVNRALTEKWDRIISVGQLVPHEVIGIANHAKNVFVGAGGKQVIDHTHFLGAVCNMERMMGRARTPVRDILEYMANAFRKTLPPITYLLTVRQKVENEIVTRGLFAGDDIGSFIVGCQLAVEANLDLLAAPLTKVVVYLDPSEFKSTWLGNKAIYRTRLALADNAELFILAPGVRMFGEDAGIDRLIRRHGYHGTPAALAAIKADPELAASLSAAAHLIHGSSEGRFHITYAAGGLTRAEVEGVGFAYADPEQALVRYDPSKLRDGENVLSDGEKIFFISNPALGLWALAEQFAS
ncbi:MAG TPA: gluconokinase, GntK/IdnK-type [Polyangiaceae bacterium]|jgi:carbohydrate kinase (thermoresistant glucokinase family)